MRDGLWTWNFSALFYRWTYGPLAHHLDACLIDFLGGDLRGKVVADVGCGPGVVTRKLLEHGAERVLALDASPVMLAQVGEARGSVKVQGRVEDGVLEALRPDHAPEGFDAVVFKRSLYHPRPVALQVLRAAWRQLRPEGILCVVHPEASLRTYAFGSPARLRSFTAYHLFNRALSRLGVWMGSEPYTVYTRDALVELACEVAGPDHVSLIPSQQRAFNMVAIHRVPLDVQASA